MAHSKDRLSRAPVTSHSVSGTGGQDRLETCLCLALNVSVVELALFATSGSRLLAVSECPIEDFDDLDGSRKDGLNLMGSGDVKTAVVNLSSA